jgi:hypothetical protein
VTRSGAGALVATVVAGLMVLLALGFLPAASLSEVAAAGAGAGAGAVGVPTASGASPTPAPATTTTRPVATTSTTRGPLGNGQPVTIAFAGDSHFESGLRSQLSTSGASMLRPLDDLFAGADLTVVNLETAITERGSPQPKEWTFRAPPAALDALAGVGVDAVSMANNHGLDFGAEGLEDSLLAREGAPLAVLGIGRDAADAYRPFRAEVEGQRIAVIAATQVLDEELIPGWTATDTKPGLASAKTVSRLTAAVAAARATSDTVVVFLHWGQERTECPTQRQRDLAPELLAAGADIVVGSHAHRLLGAGRMGEGFVAYGLGNFIWFNESGPNGDTGTLVVTATGRRIDDYEWRPARIRNGVPHRLEGPAADDAQQRWQGLRTCTGLVP